MTSQMLFGVALGVTARAGAGGEISMIPRRALRRSRGGLRPSALELSRPRPAAEPISCPPPSGIVAAQPVKG